jgi:hypothetical protein
MESFMDVGQGPNLGCSTKEKRKIGYEGSEASGSSYLYVSIQRGIFTNTFFGPVFKLFTSGKFT